MSHSITEYIVEYGRAKQWIAHVHLLPGMGNKLRQQWSLGGACAVAVILRRTNDGKDGGRTRHTNDTDVHLRIHHVIVVSLPSNSGHSAK